VVVSLPSQPWRVDEVLHSVASLCSASLPDMELSAIYNSLTTCTTTIALAQGSDCVRSQSSSKLVNGHSSIPINPPSHSQEQASPEGVASDDGLAGLISGAEDSDNER